MDFCAGLTIMTKTQTDNATARHAYTKPALQAKKTTF